MHLFHLTTALLLFCATTCFAAEQIILDTDLGADVDDAGAFAVMHALADRGEVEILAIGIVNTHENAVPCADAINTFFGRPRIPVGTTKHGRISSRMTCTWLALSRITPTNSPKLLLPRW